MRRITSLILPVTFLLPSWGALGCGDDDDEPCAEPTYAGDASDEAWRTMVDGEDAVTVGDEHAPTITSPAEGATVSAGDVSLLVSWDSPIARGPAPRRSAVRVAAAPAWLDGLSALVEGTAWAHLPPVTGDVYWVRITVPGQACAIEAVTTELSWQVDGAAWESLQGAAGETASIDVMSAYLTENRITEGPYRPAAPRTVTIGP